jgi:hypothetical protein
LWGKNRNAPSINYFPCNGKEWTKILISIYKKNLFNKNIICVLLDTFFCGLINYFLLTFKRSTSYYLRYVGYLCYSFFMLDANLISSPALFFHYYLTWCMNQCCETRTEIHQASINFLVMVQDEISVSSKKICLKFKKLKNTICVLLDTFLWNDKLLSQF